MFSPQNAKTRMLLFTLLAPITVPGYVLFLAISNLLGAAFYIVFEATISRIAKRPISLTRRQMIILALPVLLASPFAAAGHFLIAAFRGVGRALCAVGHWQTGMTSKGPAFVIGSVWVLAAVWCSLVCFNAAMAMGYKAPCRDTCSGGSGWSCWGWGSAPVIAGRRPAPRPRRGPMSSSTPPPSTRR